MNGVPGNGAAVSPYYTSIRLEGFPVTWAGENPFRPGFFFGSEDGRILLTDEEGKILLGPMRGSISGEAINGVARSGEWLAVSTREEVTLASMRMETAAKYGPMGVPHGAHGVITGPSGTFLAPMGKTGIMRLKPGSGPRDPVGFLSPSKEGMYFYRMIALPGSEGKDFLACATRKGGLGLADVNWNNQVYDMAVSNVSEFDAMDVCHLGGPADSPSIGAVGRDGTIVLVRDALRRRQLRKIRFRALEGSPFRLMSAQGHLIVLTDQGLCLFPYLSERFVTDTLPDPFGTPVEWLRLDAVDAATIGGRWLLAVLNDEVRRFDLDRIRQSDQAVGNDVPMEEAYADTPTDAWEDFRVSETATEAVGSL